MFFFSFFRSDGVFLAVRGCGLTWFLPLIILSVCVCVCGHVCVLSVQVLKCTFTHSYTHAYCQNWLGLFVTLPTMTTSSNVKNFFGFCFVLYMYIDFLYGFPQDVGTPEYFFVSCHRLGLHTLPRGALAHEGRPKQTQIESMICAWLFYVFYLTFKQIAFHVRNIYCEGLLMCMSNYF